MSSLSDLRKELREIRKTVVRPISKMKKAEVVMELEGRKKPAMKVEVESDSESDYETPVVVKEKKAPAPKAEKPKVEKPKVEKPKVEKPKAEKPKVEKPKVEKQKPKAEVKVEKVSIKSAPRKKKAE